MGGGRRRSRSESMIKLEQQKKQSKLWFEEANNQVKADNLEKAVISYSKVSNRVLFSFLVSTNIFFLSLHTLHL